ncbi:transporter [Leifsonia sp. fls2-241-R2A-40a]|uniref:SLAC1 family transporter n=1 Tax=Leifsonia sp. fls2-241-R2A-40a TaxID=3040290 RepID=UPI0025502BCB|nr:transporter [Leifsonia sp. fls2-241-R2A-40a]
MTETTSEPGRGRTSPRIPLNTLAIAFGLAGLAGVWTTAGRLLGASDVVGQVLWIVAAVAWVWLIVAHLRRGARSAETLSQQLRHPAQGPIAALVPTVGMLLGADLHRFVPLAGTVLVLASLVVTALFAGWILAYWHAGNLTPEAFHGGYLLPTVGAGLIAATTSFRIGLPVVAIGAFAVGVFFWVVISTVLLARLAFFPPLPAALTPTCAILLAPPAVAGTAWFTINGEKPDLVSVALLGLLVLMTLQQLFLLPRYRVLPFSLGFWSFTFPLAAAVAYGIEWLSIAAFAGWQAVAWVLVALVTVVIAAIGVRSLLLVTSVRRGARRAESVLRRADNAVEGR